MVTKVIFFTGGVFSSVGKGITLANVGRIFQELGFKVSALKLDPYLNIDSGSLSPVQHGEVYVTSDGHETDLDLGHYERFIDYELSKLSCITAGKIYQRLLSKKGSQEFSGETIQVVPHLIDEIHRSIYDLMERESDADLLFVEIGGTVGDIEHLPFIEAACSFKYKYGKENVLFIHLSPVFYLKSIQEYKTKPTQHSIRQLFSHNIFPDLLILRSSDPLPESIKKKISGITLINEEDIFFCPDNESIYLIAEDLYREKIHEKILEKLNIPIPKGNLDSWKKITSKILAPKRHSIKVAIIGKYASSKDAYMSIAESLKISSYSLNAEVEIDYLGVENAKSPKTLEKYEAICVPYGFGSRGTEEKIKVIEYCRKNQIPFLGICLGMQLACIEYARNVLNIKGANSTEIDENTDTPLLISLPGGQMRLGSKTIRILPNTLMGEMFGGKTKINSRHRHRYYFNNRYINLFKNSDFVISAVSDDGLEIVEIIELKNHPFFIATQFHPEFETKFTNISPIFTSFIKAGIKRKYRGVIL